jgi:ketosteroid isomerase-like protein
MRPGDWLLHEDGVYTDGSESDRPRRGPLPGAEFFADCNARNSVHNRTAATKRVGVARTENLMVEEFHRQRVLNLLEAFYRGDIERALSMCSDDVDFFSNAPVDILPHLGHRRGKDEVREMWETVHKRYSSMRYQMPFIVAEGDKVAIQIRVFFGKRRNKRVVQFDIAVFFTFVDGKIAGIREIIDTFDLIQQVVESDIISLIAAKAGKNI